MQDAQIIWHSDVIYKNNQMNLDFNNFLVLQKNWDSETALWKNARCKMHILTYEKRRLPDPWNSTKILQDSWLLKDHSPPLLYITSTLFCPLLIKEQADLCPLWVALNHAKQQMNVWLLWLHSQGWVLCKRKIVKVWFSCASRKLLELLDQDFP